MDPLDYTYDDASESLLGNDESGEANIQKKLEYYDSLTVEEAEQLRLKVLGKSVIETIQKAFELYGDRPFLGSRKKMPDGSAGEYVWHTYSEVQQTFINFATGLRTEYIAKPGDFLAICSPNRAEWVIADLAMAWQSIVSIPIHFELDQQSIEYILNHAECVGAVCHKSTFPKFVQAAANCVKFKKIISMDSVSDSDIKMAEEKGVKVYTMEQIEEKGSFRQMKPSPREPTDIHTIIYTSGSTGIPKGAVTTEQRWNTFISVKVSFPLPAVHLSYAPLAHAMERQHIGLIIPIGGCVGFYQGNPSKIFEDAQELKPTFFSGPPRLWIQLYSEYLKLIPTLCLLFRYKQALPLASKMVDHSKWTTYYTDNGVPYYYNSATSESTWDSPEETLVKKQFSKLLGGRTNYIVTGGALTGEPVLEFLRKMFQCHVFDGYGCTETGGISNNNFINIGVAIRLEDVSELGYTAQSKPFPAGEICVKTPVLVNGYFKDEQTTKSSFTEDGYFRTGDIGIKLQDGTVKIVDRKKSIIKLTQGEFVAPENLENIFIASPYIEQIFVHAEPGRSSVVALVLPNIQAASGFLNTQVANLKDLVTNENLKQQIINSISDIGTHRGLKRYEIPQHIFLLSEMFTSENGLLTPSMKNKRQQIAKQYQNQLNELWDQTELRFQELTKVITKALGVQEVSDSTTTLEQLGTDSLSTVRLFSFLKETFHTEIPVEILTGSSINEIASYIASGAKTNQLQHQFQSDLETESDFIMPQRMVGDVTNPQIVFLTGATGFLGIYLLNELLQQTKAVIHCLIRSPGPTEALEKILAHALEAGLTLPSSECSRIIAVCGDLTKPRFGVDTEVWNSLSESVDVIYHCGAQVNWVLPYNQLRIPNLLGTIEISKLATQSKLKPVQFISTLGLAGYTEGSFVDDSSLVSLNSYTLTKYAAEKYLLKVMLKGLPVSIYRPGMITGSSTTGFSNPSDFVNRMFRGFVAMSSFPATTKSIDMTPVDHVAKAIVACSLQVDCITKTYHVRKSHPVTFSTIGKVLQQSFPLTITSYSKWQAQLQASESNPLFELLPFFPVSEERVPTAREYSSYNLEAALEGVNLANLLQTNVPNELLQLCILCVIFEPNKLRY